MRAEPARDDRVRGGVEDGGGGGDVPVSGGALASAGPAPALPRLLGRDQPARQVRACASCFSPCPAAHLSTCDSTHYSQSQFQARTRTRTHRPLVLRGDDAEACCFCTFLLLLLYTFLHALLYECILVRVRVVRMHES